MRSELRLSAIVSGWSGVALAMKPLRRIAAVAAWFSDGACTKPPLAWSRISLGPASNAGLSSSGSVTGSSGRRSGRTSSSHP